MADFTIEAEPRTIVGKKVSQLRANDIVPITVYGPKVEPMILQVPYRPLEVTLMKAGGTNLIDLKVNGKIQTVLAREVQRNVLKGTIIHVDFFAVDESTSIRTDVPVHFVGESPAVAAKKGILLTGTNTITIETLPSKLMHVIEVDLSVLVDVGDVITAGDLKLGEGIKIVNDPEDMIARISQTSAARAEEDLEAETDMVTSAEPEVISKGKIEEDED